MLTNAPLLLEVAYGPFQAYCPFDGGSVEVSSTSIRIDP